MGGGGAELGVCGLVSLGDGGRRHGAGVRTRVAASARGAILRWQSEGFVEDATRLCHDPERGSFLEITPFRVIVRVDFTELPDLADELLPQEVRLGRHLHGRHNRIKDLRILDLQSRCVVDAPRVKPPVAFQLLAPLVEPAQYLTDGDALRMADQDVLVRTQNLLHSTVDGRDVFVAEKTIFHLFLSG